MVGWNACSAPGVDTGGPYGSLVCSCCAAVWWAWAFAVCALNRQKLFLLTAGSSAGSFAYLCESSYRRDEGEYFSDEISVLIENQSLGLVSTCYKHMVYRLLWVFCFFFFYICVLFWKLSCNGAVTKFHLWPCWLNPLNTLPASSTVFKKMEWNVTFVSSATIISWYLMNVRL